MGKNKIKPIKLPELPEQSVWDFDDDVYIKQEIIDNEPVWSIYNPAGEQLAYTTTKAAALSIVQQNNFHAFSVH